MVGTENPWNGGIPPFPPSTKKEEDTCQYNFMGLGIEFIRVGKTNSKISSRKWKTFSNDASKSAAKPSI